MWDARIWFVHGRFRPGGVNVRDEFVPMDVGLDPAYAYANIKPILFIHN